MIKIPTEAFKVMVAKAAKGASCNKVVPVTSLIQISYTPDYTPDNGILCLSTTDTENTLEVYRNNVEGGNTAMTTVVGVELFSRLIAKQTCDRITLDLKKDYLQVKGNGVYKVPLVMDEEGVVAFPEFEFERVGDPETALLSSVNRIVNVNKPSVDTNPDRPQLCAYYVHVADNKSTIKEDAVLSTNEAVICCNSFKFLQSSAFITPTMMDLLTLNTCEEISCYRKDGFMLFETDDVVIHGPEHDMLEDFPLNTLAGFVNLEFPSSCEVVKESLQDVLDRLALFIEAFDKNGAHLNFEERGLQIKSKQNSSDEVLKYQKSNNYQPFSALVDIPLLKLEVDSTPGDKITISYGHENAIAIGSGNVVKVIALLSDEMPMEELPEEEENAF